MKKEQIFIKDLIDNSGHMDLMLKIFAGEKGLNKEITGGEVNRPGLSLAGFFDFFAFERIQIFGLGETAFISDLSDDQKKNVYEKFFSYDIIYIDASHLARDVLDDAMNSWWLLKKNGIMIFDDYEWALDKPDVERPQTAIDAFLNVFKDKIEILHKQYQVIIKKTTKY